MIDVEFVEPVGPSRYWWMALAMVIVPVLGIWIAVAWQAFERSTLEHELATARAAMEEARRKSVEASAPSPPPYTAAALEVWKRGRFAAGQALTALETVRIAGISVQWVEIANDSGISKVEVLASDVLALNRYLDDLNGGLPAPQWHIVQVTSAPGNQGGVRAVISSRW